MKTIHAGLLTLALVGVVAAEEAKDESMFPGLHGEVEFTGVGYTGLDQSAKLEEYRDLPQGGSADWLALDFENEEATYWFDLQVKDAGQEDMWLEFATGQYGKWKAEFTFNRIPHRFAYDYGSIYNGIGGNELRIADAIQAAIESDVPQGNNSDLTNAAQLAANTTRIGRIRDFVNNAETTDEVMLQRDQFELVVEYMACDPVTFGIEVKHEERNGGRPFHGFTQFSVGLVEPIDYGTTSAAVWAAYDEGALHLKLMYEFTHFENREGTLSWDNPFINVNSAATVFPDASPSGANIFTSKSAVSRTSISDLYPSNDEHNVTLSGSYELGWETRVDASATYFTALQDDDLLAYSANPALVTGAPLSFSTTTGLVATVMPLNANDVNALPTQSTNASYEQQHYALGLTNRAIEKLEIRAGWRADNHDDDNDRFVWAGRSYNDQSFSISDHENKRLNYWRQTGGISGSYDLPSQTTLTLGYRFDNWDRHYDREVDDSWEHVLVTGLDTHPVELIEGKISYEHSWRNDDGYNGFAPFPGDPTPNGMNPFFRNFDEADRERDKLAVQFTFYPHDRITPTAGYTLLYDDYDAPLGMQEELRNAVNFGLDTNPVDRLTLNGNVTWEWSNQDLTSRQWSPVSGTTPLPAGNPYVTDLTEFSNSNWDANSQDRMLTLNASSDLVLVQDKLNWENAASMALAKEHIEMDSPIGTAAANDANLYDVSLFDISDADDSTWISCRSQFRWKVRNNLTVVVGYLFEAFDHQTATSKDYDPVTVSSTVPVPATGNTVQYLGPVVDPEDYVNHAGFITVLWEF